MNVLTVLCREGSTAIDKYVYDALRFRDALQIIIPLLDYTTVAKYKVDLVKEVKLILMKQVDVVNKCGCDFSLALYVTGKDEKHGF